MTPFGRNSRSRFTINAWPRERKTSASNETSSARSLQERSRVANPASTSAPRPGFAGPGRGGSAGFLNQENIGVHPGFEDQSTRDSIEIGLRAGCNSTEFSMLLTLPITVNPIQESAASIATHSALGHWRHLLWVHPDPRLYRDDSAGSAPDVPQSRRRATASSNPARPLI